MAPLSCFQFQRYVRHKYDVIKFTCDDLEKVILEYDFEPNNTLLERVKETHNNVKNICQDLERVLLEFANDKPISQDVASSDIRESRLYQLLTQGNDLEKTPVIEISLAPKIEQILVEELDIDEDVFEPAQLNNQCEIIISDSDCDEPSSIKCKIKGCPNRFRDIDDLTNHVLYEHQISNYNCKKCSQNKKLSNLSEHECNINKCKIWGCDNTSLSVKERNYSHEKEHKKTTGKRINHTSTLKNDPKFEKRIKCPYKSCDKYFKKFCLASHIKQHH